MARDAGLYPKLKGYKYGIEARNTNTRLGSVYEARETEFLKKKKIFNSISHVTTVSVFSELRIRKSVISVIVD